ncbi:MAG: GDSL-type esterase/lipase family protein [Polyangiaceae bacterium]
MKLPATCVLALSLLATRPAVAEQPRCSDVVHIGDSLTAHTKESLAEAYRLVGVTARLDAFGGRSALQKLPRDPQTGHQAARAIAKSGFTGCWVIALGTNDTANVSAGAAYSRADAIDAMMRAIDPAGRAPVVWVSSFTTLTKGHWSKANMQLWNRALLDAAARWSNLRVFDWAAIAASGSAPFADGIHHTKAGYAVRNRAIAEAVAAASQGGT